jgi:hypothetical protein
MIKENNNKMKIVFSNTPSIYLLRHPLQALINKQRYHTSPIRKPIQSAHD